MDDHKKAAGTINPSEVYVVEASAGSGKTYALAQRYLALLFDPALRPEDIPLKNILAITFTNKACFEMKARIVLFLKQLALDRFDRPADKQRLLERFCIGEEDGRRKAFAIMEAITRTYNYFQVQTIDSFINSILSGCAFKLDLSADFRIKHDYREYLAYSFDTLIEEANSDPGVRKHFHDFLQSYLHLENKKGWFPKQDILDIMKILLAACNTYGARFKPFERGYPDILAKRKEILEMMRRLKAEFPENANMVTWKKFANDFGDLSGPNEINAFFTPFSKETFLMRKGFECPEAVLELWRGIKDEIRLLCEWEAASRFNAYIEIFSGVQRHFLQASRDDDIMFLEELNNQARRLFGDGQVTVPELYYRLATQFRHFLIDEFQDTSVLQWGNLNAMVEEALANGGSLFYVGDKKQAIYRFRGGEVQLIDAVKDEFGRFSVVSEALKTNYRSQKAVVEFNNAVFSRENIAGMLSKIGDGKKNAVMLEEKDIQDISGVFAGSKQEYTPGHSAGFVSVRDVDIDNRQDAKDFIKEDALRLVSSLSSRFRYRDIAFLCRTNDEVELVTSWLLERQLPVESEKTLNIREHPLVKEIVAFLRFLNSPIDDLSFATFVMGEIFTSASGLPAGKIREFLFQAHSGRDKDQGRYLYRAFRAKFPEIWDRYVEEFFKTVGFVPLYELAVTIIRTYGVLDRFAPAQGFIMKFLEVIKEQEDDYQNIDSFLEFFENELAESLYVHVSASDSINVVTIHKAKGLEFPAVIVPFFEMNIRVGGGQNRSRAFVVDSLGRDYLRLINLKKGEYTGFSPVLEARYRQEYKKALVDEFNSLYVACTRAREELYIYVPKKSGQSVNIAAGLIPDGQREFGSISAGKYQPGESGRGAPLVPIGIPRYSDWIDFLKDEFISLKQVKERALFARGEVMHAVLAEIEDISSGNIREMVAAACERVAFRYPLFFEWPSVVTAVKRLLESDQAKDIFDVSGAEVYREKGLVDERGNARRVDRIVIRGGDMLIVDYKSSRPADTAEYRGQVQGYAAILRQIHPGVKMRGILLYLDELSIEDVDCSGAAG